MAPSKTRAAATLPTINDDVKYKTKYKELKVKIGEIDEDNTKLQLSILKSKKAIQRLRIERAILYDRLQSTVAPSNPFALHTVPHLSSLPPSLPSTTAARDPNLPPSILDPPNYPLADPHAPTKFLRELDGAKLRAVEGAERWGDRPESGVQGEVKREVGENGAHMQQQQPPQTTPAAPTAQASPFPVVETAPGGVPLPAAANGAPPAAAAAPTAMDVDA